MPEGGTSVSPANSAALGSLAGAPFYDDASIVFGNTSGSNTRQDNSPSETPSSTATASAAAGGASPNPASRSGAVTPFASVYTGTSGTPIYLWLALAAAAGLTIYVLVVKK